ncbi:Endonuclease/exonuclease/phosphatase [hydrothermal vent metagenome]|uniref:Endonuclease/exonuclease/phosphatase n=1 Tax=hydrothermal vent metagenome TaxID=652676 RepID=A0A3B0QTE3_9ZZZZ
MKKNRIIALLICLFGINTMFSQETFKIMHYNLLNYPLQDASKLQYLEVILDTYRPDLFTVNELNNQAGADAILSSLQFINPNYNSATFVTNSSDDNIGDQNDLQNFVYFDSSKFILISQTQVKTIFRDFNHYTFKLNTVNQAVNPIFIQVIVCHLKASSGTTNQNLRLQMVNDLETYLDTFPSTDYVILGGDLNLYTSSEPAFVELTDVTNNITFVDPANSIGSWHNNTNYLDVFTQSTRTQTGLGGATGGFDDRFDFILTSESMLTNPDIFYVSNSYQVYGNNGNLNCFNSEINTNNCSGITFDATIRNALYNMSDHLPVTLELQTNETLSTISYTLTQAFRILGSNLVTDKLSIQIDTNKFKSDFIYIFNTLGQKIESFKVENLNLLQLNVSNLSNGIYYIAASNYDLKPLKFIKSN